jgi:hypothetical protein
MKQVLREFAECVLEESLEDDLEEKIDELRTDSTFESVDSFAEEKLNNDEFEYNFLELQALARNVAEKRLGHDVTVAPTRDIEAVKLALGDLGFKFVGRQVTKHVRGVTSNAHGTHPFAGSGAGGTGFSSDGLGVGSGPGAMGSKSAWNPNAPGSLKGPRR